MNGLYIMISKIKVFLIKFHIPTTLLILSIYFLLVLISWIVLKNTGYTNEEGNAYSFFDVFLWNFLTVAGNDYAFVDSTWARILGILFLLFSMFGLSAITGYISSALVEKNMNHKKGLKKMQNMKNHIIICGWKNDIKILIADILKKNKKLTTSDIILINSLDDSKIQMIIDDEKLKGINYLKGDYTEEQTLINANAKYASKVLIIGENHENLDAELVDSRVFVATLMFRNINSKCHICAEVKTERYKNYLEAQNCAEVIYTEEYTRYILSTSTNYSGMSKVMSSFLDNGDGVSVQIERLKDEWIGKPYVELFNSYKSKGILVLGVLENMGVEKEIKHQILSEAQKSTNYGEIIQKLKTVKSMETNCPKLNPKDDYLIAKNTGAIIIGEEK